MKKFLTLMALLLSVAVIISSAHAQTANLPPHPLVFVWKTR
jgi:hypothetical protein